MISFIMPRKRILLLLFRILFKGSILFLPFLCGCVILKKPPQAPDSAFKQVLPVNYPKFKDMQDRKSIIEAARQSLAYLQSSKKKRLYAIGDKQITIKELTASINTFIKIYQEAKSDEELQRLIVKNFDIYRSIGSDGQGKVIFSSYYEPTLQASKKKTEKFKYPIYKCPKDLIEVDLEQFNKKWKGQKIAGRLKETKLIPYFSREYIDIHQILEGHNLELAWFDNRFDVMDLHIEGSARLKFQDGTQMRAHYGGTNGLPFKGHITTLVKTGAIPRDEISHEKAKKYLANHPEAEPWILSTNKRYTFFNLYEIKDPEEGPLGNINRPLVAGRSIAIDPKYVPLGAIAFIETSIPQTDEKGQLLGFAPKTKFVMCQDTGGAIKTPGRIDYFAGHGARAKTVATNMWNQGSLYLLLLKFPE